MLSGKDKESGRGGGRGCQHYMDKGQSVLSQALMHTTGIIPTCARFFALPLLGPQGCMVPCGHKRHQTYGMLKPVGVHCILLTDVSVLRKLEVTSLITVCPPPLPPDYRVSPGPLQAIQTSVHASRTGTGPLLLLLLLLLLLSSLSSSSLLSSSSPSSPLCRVFILIFLRQTVSLGNKVLQLFCCYYSWCLYR